MSDADPKRRPKNSAAGPRVPRFEARAQPLPPQPRPLAKSIDLADDFPERQPRLARPSTASRTARPTQRLVLGEPIDSSRLDRPAPLVEAAHDLDRARQLGTRPALLRPSFPVAESRRSFLELFWGHPLLMLLVSAVFLGIYLLASTPSKTTFSNYVNGGSTNHAENIALAPVAPGEHSVVGPPTISTDDVEAVLRQYSSPAVGTGPIWIDMGKKYGIDPAYALAFFIHESSAGTNPRWDGMKPDGSTTHNIGNISCAGYPRCLGRWRDYGSWQEGIEDWFRLIADEYVAGRQISTVEQIMPIYAPAFENDVDAYTNAVVSTVDGWRRNGVPR
jgi:hypothetical protein